MTSTSGRFLARMATAPEAEVLAARRPSSDGRRGVPGAYRAYRLTSGVLT
jgi:ribosomal protein L34